MHTSKHGCDIMGFDMLQHGVLLVGNKVYEKLLPACGALPRCTELTLFVCLLHTPTLLGAGAAMPDY